MSEGQLSVDRVDLAEDRRDLPSKPRRWSSPAHLASFRGHQRPVLLSVSVQIHMSLDMSLDTST